MEGAPGVVVLFGSGETSASSRLAYEWAFRRLRPPVKGVVLETPAGFQPNSELVARKVADFIAQHMRNYAPQMAMLPARQRGTPHSPDEPAIVAPAATAQVIFLGPGSPTYAVRQLQGSLLWQTVRARQAAGASLILASAATLAIGAYVLPVYEIFKVGLDLHWQVGLDLLAPYGLSLVFVPHWNNNDGGTELDTSCCFMGRERYERLERLLPAGQRVVCIEEHTALLCDLATGQAQVAGVGHALLRCAGHDCRLPKATLFPLTELGEYRLPTERPGLSEVFSGEQADGEECLDPLVQGWVQQREEARTRMDWSAADALRRQITAAGWNVQDTPAGPHLRRESP